MKLSPFGNGVGSAGVLFCFLGDTNNEARHFPP